MRVAVTGATGFLGAHVLKALESQGAEVIASSRFHSHQYSIHDKVKAVPMDLNSPPRNPFKALKSPDVLIHLAWGGLPNYRSSWHTDHELPIQKAFLRSCVRGGLQRLIVSGTCFEYGMASGELNETQELKPVTCYGEAKARLLKDLQSLQEHTPFELTWLRLFYLFGPGQSPRSLYPLLREAISQGLDRFDMSGGEQIRDYLAVEDATRMLVYLAINEGNRGPVNLCSGIPTRIKDLVAMWITEAGSSIKMNLGHYPYPDYEPMAFWGNTNRLDKLLTTPAKV